MTELREREGLDLIIKKGEVAEADSPFYFESNFFYNNIATIFSVFLLPVSAENL